MRAIQSIIVRSTPAEFLRALPQILNDWKYCVLILYSGDTPYEKQLSQFIRNRYDSLDRMSGPDTVVYTWEHPKPGYGRIRLPQTSGGNLGLMVPIVEKDESNLRPFTKAEAYAIARTLGISAKAIPCIMIFTRSNMTEVIKPYHLPTHLNLTSETFTEFFRSLFTILEGFASDNPRDLEKVLERDLFPKSRKGTFKASIQEVGWIDRLVSAVVKGTVDSLKEG